MYTSLTPGIFPISPANSCGHRVVRIEIRSAHLNINGSRQTLIQNGIHHASGLEICTELRHFLFDFAPHSVDVLETTGGMLFGESYLHGGRVRSGIRRIDRGKSGDHADVGNDQSQVFRIHGLADKVLEPPDLLIRDLDAGARWCLYVYDKLARIGSREKCQAEKRK